MPDRLSSEGKSDTKPEAGTPPSAPVIKTTTVLAFCGITFTVLAGQIILSRLFAGTLTYYYAFMLVSMAMLGLAAGGLMVELAPATFTPSRLASQAWILSAAMGAAAFGGTLTFLHVYSHLKVSGLDTNVGNFWPLLGIFLSVFPFFLFGGIVVSLVLGHGRHLFAKIYAADLVSASLGCVLAVMVMAVMTPVEAMLRVVAVIPLISAALFAFGERRNILSLLGAGAAILFLLLGARLTAIPSIAKPPHIRSLRTPTYVDEWNTFSNVRVQPGGFFSWCLSPTYKGPKIPMLLLMIDGVGGTSIARFDGNPQTLQHYDYLDYDLTALGQNLVPTSGRQLIIGPGGGFDVLQSVRRGRSDINIVEINPLVASVVNDDLAVYSGSPYHLPGVKLHIGNGRTFIKGSTESWDLLTLTWVDTGGSPQSLAFSENYLYTVDAYKEYLRHLRPDGIFSFVRALDYPALKTDSLRGISIAVEALRETGVSDVGRHIIVAASSSPFFRKDWIMCLVLVKKSPFTESEIQQARLFISKLDFQPMWLPDGSPNPDSVGGHYAPFAPLIHEIITSNDREKLYADATLDITPTTDDNPFYFVERAGKNRQAGIGVRDLSVYLIIQAILVVPFLFIPLLPQWKDLKYLGMSGTAALLYFSLLGTAFMLVEIEFFNVFALVLGSPTFTLAAVLSSLLAFSGMGSLMSGPRIGRGNIGTVMSAFTGLIGVLFVFLIFKSQIMSFLVPLPLIARIVGTVVCIAPMAFFMGMPLPAGMSVIRNRRDLLLWCWAVNGAFSVFATTSALYLAINFGIARTFFLGLIFYVMAGFLLLYLRSRVSAFDTPDSSTANVALEQ